MKKSAEVLAKELDGKNLKKIQAAFDEKRIDRATKDYLEMLYCDGMRCFRNQFYFLGRTLGAPKTPIYTYDSQSNSNADEEIDIADIGPTGAYIVNHRFDNDPMRNQFFTFSGTAGVSMFVSSIVNVIVAAQKNVGRALDKITGKYYDDYLAEVVTVVSDVLSRHEKTASIDAVADKIIAAFRAEFVSNPSPMILKIIGNLFPSISVDLVRGLDSIQPPFARLNDAYRIKLLFDTVPQINAFIDHVRDVVKDRVLQVKNSFYNLDNRRSYRDAKIIIGFDADGRTIPFEVICNVRTFFEAERQSHLAYESVRATKTAKAKSEKHAAELHNGGILEYNTIICRTVQHLLHRVGWNILYVQNSHVDSIFQGFPRIKRLPYSQKIVDAILEKIKGNVGNEVFRLPYAPRRLSEHEEIEVFRYITEFILFSALPYSWKFEDVKNMGFSGKVFNFVMKELYRYYENEVLQ